MAALGYTDVGERSVLSVGTATYMVLEAAPSVAAGFGSWRQFLIAPDHTITQLAPAISGGGYSLGNPKMSYIMLPDGRGALYLG